MMLGQIQAKLRLMVVQAKLRLVILRAMLGLVMLQAKLRLVMLQAKLRLVVVQAKLRLVILRAMLGLVILRAKLGLMMLRAKLRLVMLQAKLRLVVLSFTVFNPMMLRMNSMAVIGDMCVETSMLVCGVVDDPLSAVRLEERVFTMDDVTVSLLFLILEVTRVRILYAVFEVILWVMVGVDLLVVLEFHLLFFHLLVSHFVLRLEL